MNNNGVQKRIRVRVPATSANLGPGFDTLGLALNIYNYIEIGPACDGRDHITTSGSSDILLPQDQTNIALSAVHRLLRQLGSPAIPLHLHLENHIPFARGLGSSAAARAGALVAANLFAQQNGWPSAEPDKILALATQLEGHPDNAAAALLGGLTVSAMLGSQADVDDAGATVALRVPIGKFPRLLIFIPDNELPTSEARRVLAIDVSRVDANFNIARSSLLVAALAAGRHDLLPYALEDRLHQAPRAALIPGFDDIVAAARDAGAYGATLSGAGPTILFWLPDDEEVVTRVEQAVKFAAQQCNVSGEVRAVEVDNAGCVLVA